MTLILKIIERTIPLEKATSDLTVKTQIEKS